jgi:hypothetical protein
MQLSPMSHIQFWPSSLRPQLTTSWVAKRVAGSAFAGLDGSRVEKNWNAASAFARLLGAGEKNSLTHTCEAWRAFARSDG